eukprot:gnl/Spiro4/18038_TR9629_c0_g1_i1.p1 gnl/Spiro4/18038_TR9629_c0_g1~~gnl/Spiro4/18038_TR9629_c0_g1_i1.p1  ORF type:complete len:195 (-),score=19.98 gnl/Spiro4/18038_TR9629_c0_g1_i1:46-630(-)
MLESQTIPEMDRLNCKMFVRNALRDPEVRHLITSLKSGGCIPPQMKGSDLFRCVRCNSQHQFAGFSASPGDVPQVVLCADQNNNQNDVVLNLVHEMVHFFDWCRGPETFHTEKTIACTEVRAAALSGDCAEFQERMRGHATNVPAAHMTCVRRHALLSVRRSPLATEPEKAINEVFERCYEDTSPFQTYPKRSY